MFCTFIYFIFLKKSFPYFPIIFRDQAEKKSPLNIPEKESINKERYIKRQTVLFDTKLFISKKSNFTIFNHKN